MSTETRPGDSELAKPTTDTSDPLELLMTPGAGPARASDLEQKAIAAAEAALAQGQQAIAEFTAAHGTQPAPRRSPARPYRIWALRALLAVNLVLMGLVLVLPGTPKPAPQPPDAPQVSTQAPESPRFPDRQLYEHALMRANEGQYGAAILAIEEYLRRNPNLPDYARRGVYLQLQYYLQREGRIEESRQMLAKAAQLMERSFLPEDLLQGAALAEKNGNGEEMRRNYARFLLLQKTLPAALRKHVAEAYLKLGDSYRLEAERGEQKATESGAGRDPATRR